MTEQQFGQWLTALKSGKYMQHRLSLTDDRTTPQRHCCIGVYVAVVHGPGAVMTYPGDDELPEQGTLVNLNDHQYGRPALTDRYARVIWLLESAPELFITSGAGAV